jgi:hypothetical protein
MTATLLKTCSDRFDLTLAGDNHARMQDALGWRVTAANGALWITQDGDMRDVVLAAGESFAFDRPAALVSAFGTATAQFAQLEGKALSLAAPQRMHAAGCLDAAMA